MALIINKQISDSIIKVFNKRENGDYDFDSHEFISVFKMAYPCEYYKSLLSYMAKNDIEGAFQHMHAAIGRYLSKKHIELNIQSADKHNSTNYKGGETPNEKWRKL